MQARGEFEVNLQPLVAYATGSEGITLGRMSIQKTFRGDLAAQSQGEMLTALSGVQGSGGYVAIEQVGGTLHGRIGAFVLQHFGIMDGGVNSLVLEVVPGSGTGQLTDLRGKMSIFIEDGRHFYEFDYVLP